ncbi:S1 family peptidase [Saccharothrix obliqua]|uniref:S1 family peptidase n=1 Tax=Saccharothrix obliqua TaxID=2861747 RepID=UPI001C5CFA06|nr:S1 family peptidase [Saccharothrix obliqua]MBW4716606.1 S1 family peptidase [Saccharothrix obliqua]
MRTLLTTLAALLLAITAPTATAAPAAAPVKLEAGSQLPGTRCVNGFNTHGHLLVSPTCARANSTLPGVGPVVAVRDAYAVVRLAEPEKWYQSPTVAGRPVTGSTPATVGSSVCTSSRTSGWHCGTVQALNQSVSYPDGVVTGLTRTNLCVQPGDSWNPVISGGNAQGHIIGGSHCTAYFLPLNRILSAEQLTLVTA